MWGGSAVSAGAAQRVVTGSREQNRAGEQGDISLSAILRFKSGWDRCLGILT